MDTFRPALMALIMFSLSMHASADTFRVRSLKTLDIDYAKPEAQSVELGYNDALAVLFKDKALFLRAIEVEIKIPQEMIAWRNSMAYGVYNLIKPLPESTVIDYQGERLDVQTLPSRLTFVLQIPLIAQHGLKEGPYSSLVPSIHKPLSGPLLFRLFPVMKGLPDNIESLTFPVKVKPLLTDEGGFLLDVAFPSPDKLPVTVRIDEKPYDQFTGMHILGTGTHHLSIVSEHYRNEVRVFTIEQGKITRLAVPLKDTAPRLLLTAPENARILIDGQPVSQTREPIIMESGEHTILFQIGDYEIARTIDVEKGKDYTVSMLIDIQITESY